MESTSPNPSAIGAEERRIRLLLQEGRWRKARDEVKPLCKKDRARFFPLLIEANVGLAREMLDKGLISEARQVISYLKTIAPPDACRALELSMTLKSGGNPAGFAAALQGLQAEGTTLPEAQRMQAADQLVAAFQPMPASADSPVAAELAAIHNALAAVCAERYDEAAEWIRPIPYSSLFRHWKLYIKGLVAFHRGDTQRAMRTLSEVPPDTTPGRASLPYLYWLNGTSNGIRLEDLKEHAWEVLARMAATPESARLLVRVERLWNEGRPDEAYMVLRGAIEAFPSEDPDWIGTLSEFCLNSLFNLPLEERDKYGGFFAGLEQRGRPKSAREAMLLIRVLCLDCESDPDPIYLRDKWTRFLGLRERLEGANPRLSSLAYEWLARMLSRTLLDNPFRPARNVRMPDARGALSALEKSVALDPDNFDAHILLATLYERLKRTSERNRLLDEMTRRFPANKQVLLMAGNRCVERKAYAKGIAYLQRALDHDLLDPAIPDAIALARTLYALEHFRRGRAADGRRTLDALADFIVDRPDHFQRSRWSIALRRSILEQMYGDDAHAKELLGQARAAAPSPEALLLFGHILWKRYERNWSNQDRFSSEFRATARSRASAGQAVMLVRIFDFWKSRSGAPPLNIAENLVRDYLRFAARRPFTRDEARELIDCIPPQSTFDWETRSFIAAIRKKDRKDPLFRLYDYRFRESPFDPPQECRNRLEAILKEAVRRKDDAAIQGARRELDALDVSPPISPFGPFADEDDLDGELEEDEDFEPDSLEDALSELLDSWDPRELSEFQQMLRNASERELRLLKKTKPKGMPEEIFDLFLDGIRQGKFGSPSEPTNPRRARRDHPKQGSLF